MATRVPIKTLRYYHEIGLLVPTRVEQQTGYRYYRDDQIDRVAIIRELRELEFSLQEIGSILDARDRNKNINEYLAQRRLEIRERVSRLLALENRLEDLQNPTPREGEVVRRWVPGVLVASQRFTGTYAEVGCSFGRFAPEVYAHVAGPPFTLYWQAEYIDDGADMETCIPLSRVNESANTVCRVVPGQHCLVTVHHGPYETLSVSYRRLLRTAASDGLEIAVPIRERYIVDPQTQAKPGGCRPEPADYITEIAIPWKQESRNDS